jgi:hypothetical protein
MLYKIELKNMKRKKHKLKAHGILLKYHKKLSYITHGILAKKIKAPVMGY